MRRSSSTDVCCSALFWRAATTDISNADDGVAATVDDTLSDFFAAEESGWDVGTGNAMLNVNDATSPAAGHIFSDHVRIVFVGKYLNNIR